MCATRPRSSSLDRGSHQGVSGFVERIVRNSRCQLIHAPLVVVVVYRDDTTYSKPPQVMLRFGKQVLRRPRVLLGFGGGLGLWASASNKTQNSRPNIVFDLDGTLATTLKIRKDSDREKLLQARESDFVMKDEAANADDVHQQQQQQQRHVWIRPHAVWVLRLLATFCNIHLFTEAKQEYRPDHRPQDANHDAIKTICGRSSKWIVCPHNANVLRSNAVT
jgi:hypothetical protein